MPTQSPSSSSRTELRRQLRAVRRALSPAQRHAGSLKAAGWLLAHPWYRQSRNLALYYPVGSETDTSALFAAARQDGKKIFLPAILQRGGRLLFVRLRRDSALARRRHGIPQPRPSRSRDVLAARRLDLVIVPLLGFDRTGHRLGSGAGYYDRSFGFRHGAARRKPRLLGLAFACQRLEQLNPTDWDVPLDAAVTEDGWHAFPSAS